MRRRLIDRVARALLAANLLLPCSGPAAARARRWVLDWHAPPGCPTGTAIQARVDALLGGPVPLARVMRVAGEVRAQGDGWQVVLVARTGDGRARRRLQGRDCAALGEVAALVVALAIDPTAVANLDAGAVALLRASAPTRDPRPVDTFQPASAPTRDPRPVDPVQPALREPAAWVGAPEWVRPVALEPARGGPSAGAREAPAARPAASGAPRRGAGVRPGRLDLIARGAGLTARRAVWVALRALGGLGAGPLPVAGGLFGAVAALGLGRRARVELQASRWTTARTRFAAFPDAGVDFTLTTGGLRGCGVPGRGIVEVPLCLGLEVGGMRGGAVGLKDGRIGRSLWAAVTPGVALAVVPTRRFAAWLAVDGHVALVRPRFRVDGAGEVWRPGVGGVRVTLGVELRFSGR